MEKCSHANLHAWAAVGWNYKSPFIFYEGGSGSVSLSPVDYKNQILQPHIQPLVAQKRNFILLEDDRHDSSGVYNSTHAYMDSIRLHHMKNPPCSSDLNIIKNIWGILTRQLAKRSFDSQEALRRGILEEWEDLDQGEINQIVYSMKGRVNEIIRLRGKIPQCC